MAALAEPSELLLELREAALLPELRGEAEGSEVALTDAESEELPLLLALPLALPTRALAVPGMGEVEPKVDGEEEALPG